MAPSVVQEAQRLDFLCQTLLLAGDDYGEVSHNHTNTSSEPEDSEAKHDGRKLWSRVFIVMESLYYHRGSRSYSSLLWQDHQWIPRTQQFRVTSHRTVVPSQTVTARKLKFILQNERGGGAVSLIVVVLLGVALSGSPFAG
ncbi:hypothetical protein EDD16DRAFT_1520949 [Pisolithus croceorrhizus]|nr:hypothetical protein EDD16DRAFT_1520949 [Pisolithus croceorrhizus]